MAKTEEDGSVGDGQAKAAGKRKFAVPRGRSFQLALLTFAYVFGELSHFLVGVTSRDMARDINYGDMACYVKETEDVGYAHKLVDCTELANETE